MALYHKYRPQTFSDVIGQTHIIQTLTRQILTDTFAHAYIFSGSRGSGKTTTARLLAKALNCVNRTEGSAEPCNHCQMCESITSGRSIDVIEIDAASHTGVDNVRENIIENSQFQPTLSKYKIFIIDEVHMLSTSSFNALLKTLEEPPKYVIFILATTEIHKIPETILSRCQRYVFSKLPKNILQSALDKIAMSEGVTLDKEVRDAIVAKADGGVRDAISLLEQIMSVSDKHISREEASLFLPLSPSSDALKFLGVLIEKNIPEALRFLQTLSNNNIDLGAFLDTFLEMLRNLMIVKIQGNTLLESDLNQEILTELQTISQNISNHDLLRLIDISLKRRSGIKNSPIAELPLELIVLEWIESDTPLAAAPTVTASPIKVQPPEPPKPVSPPPEEKKLDQREVTPAEIPSNPASEISLPETSSPSTGLVPSFQTLKNKWGEILKVLEKKSPSLVSLLKSSQLLGMEDSQLVIEVQYKLHQDKLNQKEYKKMIEDTLEECVGSTLGFKTEVKQKQSASDGQPSDIENIAAAFGGVVV